jgi:hypothetical protein
LFLCLPARGLKTPPASRRSRSRPPRRFICLELTSRFETTYYYLLLDLRPLLPGVANLDNSKTPLSSAS